MGLQGAAQVERREDDGPAALQLNAFQLRRQGPLAGRQRRVFSRRERIAALDRADVEAAQLRSEERIVRAQEAALDDLVREAARLGRTITLMTAGRVVQTGTFADLVERPATPFVRQFLTAQTLDAPAPAPR